MEWPTIVFRFSTFVHTPWESPHVTSMTPFLASLGFDAVERENTRHLRVWMDNYVSMIRKALVYVHVEKTPSIAGPKFN